MESDVALLEFLQYSLGHLSTTPKETLIRCEHRDNGDLVYRVTINEEDAGRIIGKNGRTISSLRGVLRAAANKHGTRAFLKVYTSTGESLDSRDRSSSS